MATASPIIKKIQSFKFELIDFFDLYSHLPVMARGGKAMVDNVNRLDNTVTVRSVNNPKDVATHDVRQVKLMLRRLDYIRPKDVKLIANLALDTQSFDFSASREGKRIKCEDEQGRRVIIDLSDDSVAISVSLRVDDEVYETLEAKNLQFIFSYMVKNGFDLFGLTKRSWAVSVNQVDIVRGF